jgi:hypothetical protein
MSEKPQTVSVVIAKDGEGRIKKAYYSPDAQLMIETANALRGGYDVTTLNCDLITKAPRTRSARAKPSIEPSIE